MSLSRLRRIEKELTEEQERAHAARLAEFEAWRAQHWTSEERDAFRRLLWEGHASDTDKTACVSKAAGVSVASALEYAQQVGSPTDADRQLFTDAWARLPADLAAWLKGDR